MNEMICGKIELIDNVLQAEDAKGKEPFYEKIGFEIISNGIKKIIEIK